FYFFFRYFRKFYFRATAWTIFIGVYICLGNQVIATKTTGRGLSLKGQIHCKGLTQIIHWKRKSQVISTTNDERIYTYHFSFLIYKWTAAVSRINVRINLYKLQSVTYPIHFGYYSLCSGII